MKHLSIFVLLLALLFLLIQPQLNVQAERTFIHDGTAVPLGITSTPTPVDTSTPPPTVLPSPVPIIATPEPAGNNACLRFNFEVTGHHARYGTYEVVEVLTNRSLATWEAQAGWQDSGWIYNIEITFKAVHVNVLYHPPGGGEPIIMAMANPAPGTEFGWVARDMCHALEIGWP